MGSRSASNPIEAGYAVTVCNRTAVKAENLRARGAAEASTPAAAVTHADCAISLLRDANIAGVARLYL